MYLAVVRRLHEQKFCQALPVTCVYCRDQSYICFRCKSDISAIRICNIKFWMMFRAHLMSQDGLSAFFAGFWTLTQRYRIYIGSCRANFKADIQNDLLIYCCDIFLYFGVSWDWKWGIHLCWRHASCSDVSSGWLVL